MTATDELRKMLDERGVEWWQSANALSCIYKAFMHGNCYRWCEFKEPCNYISDGKCQWYDRMRELGVEL